MGEVTAAKQQAFKAWKTGKGIRASYHAAKRIAVHHADKRPTRRSTRILTLSLQMKTTLQTSIEDRMPTLEVTNR